MKAVILLSGGLDSMACVNFYQSIDDYLGPSKSVLRQHLSNHIKDLSSRFSGGDAVSIIKELFT